jgi:hypothetical protein
MKIVMILLVAIILLLASLTAAQNPDDIYWDNTLAYSNGGLQGFVSALIVHQGKLIVAGSFIHAGGIEVGHIATWDGISWSALNCGMDLTFPL